MLFKLRRSYNRFVIKIGVRPMSRTRFQGFNFEQEIVIQYFYFIATTVRCREIAINSSADFPD
jgi:hypothetical protein